MTDMVSPDQYRQHVLPYVREVAAAIGSAGMKSVHYYCGAPAGKLDMLLEAPTDALAFEEGRQGVKVDIEAICAEVAGRKAVFGKIDAIHVLERGRDDQVRREIQRQMAAGKRNSGRFVVSVGSPATPRTPLSRLQAFFDLVHELG